MADAFALENFAPTETTKFRLSKHGDFTFEVDGDPDVDDVALMLKIEERLRQSEGEAETMAAAEEGKAILLKLIRQRQPDVSEVKAGMQEILIVFSLIVRGSSVAEAVARAITASGTAAAPATDGEPVEEGEGGAPVTPLRSPTLSSEASSSSASSGDGLPATGTG